MSIFPHIHFSISSSLSAETAFESAFRISIKLLDRDYNAMECGEDNCEILFYPESKRAFFHNPFLPIIRMTFVEQARGTVINFDSRLRSRAALFLSVIVLFGIILEAGLLILCALCNISLSAYIFIPSLSSCIVYFVSLMMLSFLSKCFLQQVIKEGHIQN